MVWFNGWDQPPCRRVNGEETKRCAEQGWWFTRLVAKGWTGELPPFLSYTGLQVLFETLLIWILIFFWLFSLYTFKQL